MKKIILVVTTFMICNFVHAQNISCNYEKNERGEVIEIITKSQVIHQFFAEYISLKGVKTNNGKFLRMETLKTEEIRIKKTHALQFTLENNEVVKLFPVDEVVSNKDSKLHKVVVNYVVPEDKIELLKKFSVKSIRYTAESGFVEHQVKDRNKDKVISLVTCLD